MILGNAPVVRVGVAALIYNKKNKFLATKRKSSLGNGLWGIVGGHLDVGETPEDCAKREAREEVGIEIGNLNFAGFTNDIFADGKHYITLFVEGDIIGGEVKNMEPEKHERWDWFTWDSLPHPRMVGIDNLLNSQFFDSLRF